MATIIEKINELYDKVTAKVAIDVGNKNTWLLDTNTNWDDEITIRNYAQLSNVRVSGDLVDSANTTVTLNSSGVISIKANGDHRSLWYGDYDNQLTFQINADNATAPITITMAVATRGRLPVCQVSNIRFGINYDSTPPITASTCGHVTIRTNIVNLGDLTISVRDGIKNGNRLGFFWNSPAQRIRLTWTGNVNVNVSDIPELEHVDTNYVYGTGPYQGTRMETPKMFIGLNAGSAFDRCPSDATQCDWSGSGFANDPTYWSEEPKPFIPDPMNDSTIPN